MELHRGQAPREPLRLRYDSLPHNSNLCRWGKLSSDQCAICWRQSKQTLAHVLNHCQPVEVPPVAICAGGHFPSTHWSTYSTCAQATCTVWWHIYIYIYIIILYTYICMHVCMYALELDSLCKYLAVVNAMPAFSIYLCPVVQ